MTRHNHDAHDHQHPGDHHGSHDAAARIITVRPASGLSGDIMLAGLAALGGLDNARLAALTEELNLPALQGCVRLEPRSVNHVAGFGCHIDLPHEHEHRTLPAITRWKVSPSCGTAGSPFPRCTPKSPGQRPRRRRRSP